MDLRASQERGENPKKIDLSVGFSSLGREGPGQDWKSGCDEVLKP